MRQIHNFLCNLSPFLKSVISKLATPPLSKLMFFFFLFICVLVSKLSFRRDSGNVACLSWLPKWFQQKMLQEQHCKQIAITSKSETTSQFGPPILRKDAFKSSKLWVPFSLEPLFVRMPSPNKVVVLLMVGNNFGDLLMSQVCGLHHFNISNFDVFALDDELYQFVVLQVWTSLMHKKP